MIAAENWSPADGLTLEPNARKAAIERDVSLALTAGPGAGKTEMLAQRADFLLRTGSCRYPRRILAISFKADASQNLKDRVRRRCGAFFASRFDSYTFHAFAKRLIDRFRPVLTGSDALDVGYTIGSARVLRTQITFNDLVPLAIQILRHSEFARNAVRQTYSHIFLDEFQDCTNQQYELVRVAFQGTPILLTAVGDTKQMIMGWAGALDGIFVRFASDFGAKPLNLYRNFRSLPRLLRLQNEIIRVLDSGSVMPDEMLAGDGGSVEVCGFATSQEESEFLCTQVARWVNEGIPYSEIAVLVSREPHFYAERLMTEFQRLGIPFRNEKDLQDLATEPLARLVLDYLLVLFGSREPEAYSRLVAVLTQTVGDDEDDSRVRNSWSRFLKAERAKLRVSESTDTSFKTRWSFAIAFLKAVGKERLVSLSADYESPARLDEVLTLTMDHLSKLGETAPDFLSALNLFREERAVKIMTIHKSKGLEFEAVVILGVEEQTFWGKPDDERCAFFVGVSRAKKHLLLTHCATRERPSGNPRKWNESRTVHKEFVRYCAPFQAG